MGKGIVATAFAVLLLAMPGAGSAAEPAAAPPPSAPAPVTGPVKVYDNGLGDGWHDQSSAKTELAVDIGSARKPIRVEAGPGQALILHHAPFATTARKLDFLIQAQAPGGGEAKVVVLAGGVPLKAEGKTVALKSGGWTKVEIPLATLGAEGKSFDMIQVQNGSAAALPVFYVSDVSID